MFVENDPPHSHGGKSDRENVIAAIDDR